jgi:site-specific recombinase XerD
LRSDFVDTNTVGHILWALQPANKLVCEVSLQTGWRVDDVLHLTTKQIKEALQKKRCTVSVEEQKTGKRSTRYLPRELCERLLEQSGRIYVFEGRDDYRKARSRQAVFLDLKRVAKKFNIKLNLSPHSLRKNYAVYLRDQGKSLAEIQKILNHDNIATTMLYAMADELNNRYA